MQETKKKHPFAIDREKRKSRRLTLRQTNGFMGKRMMTAIKLRKQKSSNNARNAPKV